MCNNITETTGYKELLERQEKERKDYINKHIKDESEKIQLRQLSWILHDKFCKHICAETNMHDDKNCYSRYKFYKPFRFVNGSSQSYKDTKKYYFYTEKGIPAETICDIMGYSWYRFAEELFVLFSEGTPERRQLKQLGILSVRHLVEIFLYGNFITMCAADVKLLTKDLPKLLEKYVYSMPY